MVGRRKGKKGPDEQYVNRKEELVTVYRGLTEHDARILAKTHGRRARISGRGDNRTVTLREKGSW